MAKIKKTSQEWTKVMEQDLGVETGVREVLSRGKQNALLLGHSRITSALRLGPSLRLFSSDPSSWPTLAALESPDRGCCSGACRSEHVTSPPQPYVYTGE